MLSYGLYPMAVKTEKLNIISRGRKYLFVESDSVLSPSFFSSSSKDMINVKNSLIANSTGSTRSSEELNSSISRRPVPFISALSREFSRSFRMLAVPFVYMVLVLLVNARSASPVAFSSWSVSTIYAFLFFGIHVRKYSIGKGRRVEKSL